MTKAIDSFTGEFRWLSNFWLAEVQYEGLTYPSSEHAYQAAKSDLAWERKALSTTPGSGKKVMSAKEAKIFGKNVSLRHNWDKVKLSVMEEILREKFKHPDLAEKLLATGEAELIEGNWWGDKFYGVCGGEGLNHLGKLLMKIREDLRKKSGKSM